MDSCNRRDRINYLHLFSSSNTSSNLFPLHAQSIPFFPIVMIKDLTLGVKSRLDSKRCAESIDRD